MKGSMGHFGEAQAPTIVMESKRNKSGVISLFKPIGYLFLGGVGILGVISILDYLDRRNVHYPDRFDADEHYLQRIKILVKKIDDGTITNKEADELNTIIYTPRGRTVGYIARDKEAYAGYVQKKLENFFKSQGT